MIAFGILAVLAFESLAAPTRIPGRLFMQGSPSNGLNVTLAQFNDRRIRVFDRQVAFRNDHKACMSFELPAELPWPGAPLRLELEAYNDDRTHLRAIWLEVDGIGGYLAVQRVAEGQHRGSGTVAPGERKRWTLPLDGLPISLKGKTTTVVDLDVVLRQPGPHTVCAWISTYAQYGPRSWITLDLVGSPEVNMSDQKTHTGPAPPSGHGKKNRRKRADVDPCNGRIWVLADRGLQLTLKQSPDSSGVYDQPVCSVLEVSRTQGEESAALLHRFDLNPGEPRMPGFLLDYNFADYLPGQDLVVLKRPKALRLYDVATHRLSPLIRPRDCIGEDGRSLNIQRLKALDEGRFLYGEAVSCQPFLIRNDRPTQYNLYLETAGMYTLFRDPAGGFLAAEPDSAELYRFAGRAGRDARFSLTYFLNEHGMAAYREKDYIQASKWFDRAAAVTPEDYLYPHTNLAGSLALAGLTKDALAQLHRACTLDPEFTRSRMLSDTDFAALRMSTRFREILQGACAEN